MRRHLIVSLLPLLLTSALQVQWTPDEDGVYYIGNDIAASSPRGSISLCKEECRQMAGCSMVVWVELNQGTCLLKSRIGIAVPMARVQAAQIWRSPKRPPEIIKPLQTLQQVPRSSTPRPSIPPPLRPIRIKLYEPTNVVYNVMEQAAWSERIPPRYFTDALNKIQDVFDVAYLNNPQDDIMTPYIAVASVGECAEIARSNNRVFFTYINKTQACALHDFSGQDELQVAHGTIHGRLPHELEDDIYTNITTSSECALQCSIVAECAVSRFIAPNCTLYSPVSIKDNEVWAGWIVDHHQSYETAQGIQYTTFSSSTLPGIWQPLKMTANANQCAEEVDSIGEILFQYDSSNNICSFMELTPAPAVSFLFTSISTIPLQLPQFEIPATMTETEHSESTCADACVPTRDSCFGSVYNEAAKKCSLYSAGYASNMNLGWITLRSSHDEILSPPSSIYIFGTAHQDDHELFMSADVIAALEDESAKVVFIYTTAGDADENDGWWEARERGTLAATKRLVEEAGLFPSSRITSTVTHAGHAMTKVVLGNAVHYFLRIREVQFADLHFDQIPDQTTFGYGERYENMGELMSVMEGIMEDEIGEIKDVFVGTSEFKDMTPEDADVDHDLHMWTGELMASVVERHPRWKTCVNQTYYFGYQRWEHERNMASKPTMYQRLMWMSLSNSITEVYKSCYPVWLDHSQHLGRQYIARTVPRVEFC